MTATAIATPLDLDRVDLTDRDLYRQGFPHELFAQLHEWHRTEVEQSPHNVHHQVIVEQRHINQRAQETTDRMLPHCRGSV